MCARSRSTPSRADRAVMAAQPLVRYRYPAQITNKLAHLEIAANHKLAQIARATLGGEPCVCA